MGNVPPLLSKIDARFQSAMVGTLGVKGQSVTPQEIDLSHVSPTLDIGASGHAGAIPFCISGDANGSIGATFISELVGVQSSLLPIANIGFIRARTPANGTFYSENFSQLQNIQYNALICGGTIRFVWDSAGATADNGKEWHVQLKMSDIRNGVDVFIMSTNFTVATRDTNYNCNFNGVTAADYQAVGIGQNVLPIPCDNSHTLYAVGSSPDGVPDSSLTIRESLWGYLVPEGAAMPLY